MGGHMMSSNLPDGRSFHSQVPCDPNAAPSLTTSACTRLRRRRLTASSSSCRLFPEWRYPPEKLETVRKGMLRLLGEDVTVLINVVDDIPYEPNGKFRPLPVSF